MGAFGVGAGGVAAVLYVEFVFGFFLGGSAGEVSLALLGDHVLDISFLRPEVVAHCAGLVVGAVLREHGFSLQLAHAVGAAECEYGVVGKVHLYFRGIEADVAVGHCGAAEHVGGVAADNEHGVGR